MTLNTPLTEALLSFRLQLSEEDVICWNKALAIICFLDLLPVAEYCMQVKDMQCATLEYDYAWGIHFEDKLIRLDCSLESEEERLLLYFCFAFLFKFYAYLTANCPGFKTGWRIHALPKEDQKEEWLFLTSFFARLQDQVFEKQGFCLKSLMSFTQPHQVESPITKVVTELKDQIVCAQIANDEKVWDNLTYSPVEGDERYEEIYD